MKNLALRRDTIRVEDLEMVRLSAFILTAAISAGMYFLPVYAGGRATATADGKVVFQSTRRTLVEVNGTRAIKFLLLPLAVALTPLLHRWLKSRPGPRSPSTGSMR